MNMDNNQYLYTILEKYEPMDSSQNVYRLFYPTISKWAGSYLNEMVLSGSSAKGTAIRGINDVDYLISLHNSILDKYSLERIYDSLYKEISSINVCTNVRKQRVSIGLTYQGVDIDFTPAVKDKGNTNYHKLYVNERNKRWVQTNIQKHIDYVKWSGRTNEIKLTKIWRMLHRLEFPSIYLESVIIENLKGRNFYSLTDTFIAVLEYLNKSFVYDTYYDISNTNNKLSDSLTMIEKQHIANIAMRCLNLNWNQVLW